MDPYLMASKFLPLLIYPLNLAVVILLAALLLLYKRRRRAALALVAAATALLAIAGNPLVAESLIAELERVHRPVAIDELPEADAIVVLGGGLALPLPPRTGLEFTESTDRLWHGARLYRAGKAPRLILSGGNFFPQPGLRGESFYAAQLLTEWGVPREAIWVEESSRNTYENALFTKQLLEGADLGSILLVTSAVHMPRAFAAFRTQGIEVIAAATDVHIIESDEPVALKLVPNAGALAATTEALKEHLGSAMYRLRGWIRD